MPPGNGHDNQAPTKKRWGSGYHPQSQEACLFNKKLKFFNKLLNFSIFY